MGELPMNNQSKITNAKLALIQKIITARLSAAELQAVTNKAQQLIQSREKPSFPLANDKVDIV